MRYASAAAAERRSAMLARKAERTVRKRRVKCMRTLEPQHLNRRVLIRKRPLQRALSCQTWIGSSENVSPALTDAKRSPKAHISGGKAAPYPNALKSRHGDGSTFAHAVFCGIRARLTSNRITK